MLQRESLQKAGEAFVLNSYLSISQGRKPDLTVGSRIKL